METEDASKLEGVGRVGDKGNGESRGNKRGTKKQRTQERGDARKVRETEEEESRRQERD